MDQIYFLPLRLNQQKCSIISFTEMWVLSSVVLLVSLIGWLGSVHKIMFGGGTDEKMGGV